MKKNSASKKSLPKKTLSKKFLPKKSLPKILIACDHAGFVLKKFLIAKFDKVDFEFVDLGCKSAEKSVDYPDYAKKLCAKITVKNNLPGILICGSGIGVTIAANRFKHIRAALCYNVKAAKLARAHNDANVLCLGARITKNNSALAIVKAFFSTEFEGARHAIRVAKLSQ
ncbi:MAG: ribose 5-phosphate isomerase B [Rickettsiales bacterium]|nr:ribose 5-phosphate isomerase B [Rickettsiales bacterium]